MSLELQKAVDTFIILSLEVYVFLHIGSIIMTDLSIIFRSLCLLRSAFWMHENRFTILFIFRNT